MNLARLMRWRALTAAVTLLLALSLPDGLAGIILRQPSGVALAQTGGPYDLTWSTIDGGGAMFSTSGCYSVGGTIGQPDPGQLSGGSYTLAGGFWPGGPAGPAAAADLRASNESGSLRLDWTAVTHDVDGNGISGLTYNVYRAVDLPYFVAGTAYEGGISDTWYFDLDPNAIGNAGHSYCYLIRAVYSGLTSTDSNRVGSFSFGLVPGS